MHAIEPLFPSDIFIIHLVFSKYSLYKFSIELKISEFNV